MEFLDDLREKREAKAKPKTQPEVQRPNTVRRPSVAPRDEKSWDELLASVSFDEPVEVPAPAPKAGGSGKVRPRKRGFTTIQMIVLGGLVVAVLAFGVVIILYVTGAFHTSSIDLSTDPATTSEARDTAKGLAGEPAASSLPEATATVESPSPTALPVPAGPLATIYDEQIRKTPNRAGLYLERGDVYMEAGAYQAALADFQRAEELDAGAAAYEGLGRANYALFRWKDAEAAFNQATALSPDLAGAHFGVGRIAFYRGDYREAAAAFDAAAEIDPQYAEYEAWLAIASAQFNDRPEALGAATRAISASGDLAIVHVARAWAARVPDPEQEGARDLDGAQGDLLHALDLGPNDSLTLNAVAEFYVAERPERLAEAEQLATYALNWAQNDVERAVALQTLGRIYLLQDRKADARGVLEEAATLASVDGEIALAGLEEDLARAK